MITKFQLNFNIKTTLLPILVIIIMGISSMNIISTMTVNNSNTTASKVNSTNFAQYFKNLENNLPLSVQTATNSYKNVIFHYTSQSERNTILDYVSHKGILVDNMNVLPFILAKIPYSDYSYLKSNNIDIFLDKLMQVIPKSTMSAASVTQASGYQVPIDQIQGQELISSNDSGQGIVIAVIDSGIDSSLPDLSTQVIGNYSFVTVQNGYSQNEDSSDINGHGTHVAGLAAGTGKSSNGLYVGVAPGTKLINLKVVDQYGSATEFGIIEAIASAIVLKVDIITMSLGFSGSSPNDPLSIALDIAVNDYGIVATVSAGNSGPGIGTVATPGSARSVITVGASYNTNDSATFFSSRGPNSDNRYDPDVLAPGWDEISTMAAGSLIGEAEQYYSPNSIIQGTGGNYIALSGTSMAAPITAGAVALLLSKYPNLTPQGVRAALMASATNTGQPEYVQGAGFLNLTKADQLIAQNYSPYSHAIGIISLLPQRSIFPDNPVLYPGEQLNVNLQFVSGASSSIGVVFTNSTFSNLISYNKSDNSLIHEINPNPSPIYQISGGYYGELLLTFTVPLNPVPGVYETTFTVTTDYENFTLQLGPVFVKVPQRSVAWNIWYQSDSTDTPTANYASLANYLETQNIHLDAVNQPIDASWIYNYGTIVFPDNELSISAGELSLLQNYINNGGNVIIISSFYPFSDIANYNQLTTHYGITVLNRTDMNIFDTGITQLPNYKNNTMKLLNTPSLSFDSSIQLNWNGGTYLSVANYAGDSVFGELTNSTPVMAGFFGNQTSKGKLLVFGSEYWFYNDFFGNNEAAFSKTIFNSMFNQSAPFVNVIQASNSVQLGQYWNASIFVGTSSFENATQSIATLKGPSGSVNLTLSTDPYTLGAYTNYKPAEVGNYVLTVNYKNMVKSISFQVYNKGIQYNLTLTPVVQTQNYPVFLQDSGVPAIDAGGTMTIGVNTNYTISNINMSVVISLVPEILQQFSGYIKPTNALYTTEIPLSQFNSTYFEAHFTTDANFNNGFYIVELLINQSNFSFDGNPFNSFFVTSPNPSIDSQNSLIGGKSVDSYNSTQNEILQISPSQSFSITITSNSSGQGLSAFVLFIPYYPFIESQSIIEVWQLNATSNNQFSGTIVLPSTTSISAENVFSPEQKLNFGSGLYTAILLILRDSQGNIDFYPIITMEQSGLFSNFSVDQVMLLVFFVIIPGIIVFIYYIRSRSKRNQDSYNYGFNNYQYNQPVQGFPQQPQNYSNQQSFQQPPPDEIKFCPYCGANILLGSNFCMECGKKIH